MKVRYYFSLKDRTPLTLKALVVYKFHGSCDKSVSYIGKTKRHLAIRIREHRTQASAIRDHYQKCEKCSDGTPRSFSVLSSGRSDFEIRIKEALCIQKFKPSLNKQLANCGLEFYLSFLNFL